jgi:uncharacterized protein YecT (DUF1311 family)
MRTIFLLPLLAATVALAEPTEVNCKDPITTIEINACKSIEVGYAKARLADYLKASLDRYEDEPKVVARIKASQKRWVAYRDDHCGAIYQLWIGGSIRGVMHGQCILELTQARTHELWRAYLTYMDSTPPLLPKPELTWLD